MPFTSPVTTSSSAGGADAATTPAINTTGTALIEVTVGWYPGTTADIVVTDNQTNTWVGLTAQTAGLTKSQKFYCLAPDTHASHTFTATGTGTFPVISVQAWSTDNPVVFSAENGSTHYNTGNAESAQPGSVSPSANDGLVTCGVCTVSVSHAIDSGFTAFTQDVVPSVSMGGGAAYLVQTVATAVNPTWTWTGNSDSALTAAAYVETPPLGNSFKSRIAGGLVVRSG